MNVRSQIEAAIRKAGSEAKLGEATGYSQHAIWRAKQRGHVTAEMALKFHEAGYGHRAAFRPDLWPEEVAA